MVRDGTAPSTGAAIRTSTAMINHFMVSPPAVGGCGSRAWSAATEGASCAGGRRRPFLRPASLEVISAWEVDATSVENWEPRNSTPGIRFHLDELETLRRHWT